MPFQNSAKTGNSHGNPWLLPRISLPDVETPPPARYPARGGYTLLLRRLLSDALRLLHRLPLFLGARLGLARGLVDLAGFDELLGALVVVLGAGVAALAFDLVLALLVFHGTSCRSMRSNGRARDTGANPYSGSTIRVISSAPRMPLPCPAVTDKADFIAKLLQIEEQANLAGAELAPGLLRSRLQHMSVLAK